MRSLLVVCLLAAGLALATALPVHSPDTALLERDPVADAAPSAPAPTPAGVAPAVRTSRQCAAAGGDCLNTATGATCPTAFRSGLCNGGATVKCCVTRPGNPALLDQLKKAAAAKKPTSGKVPARVVQPKKANKPGKGDKAKAAPTPSTPAPTPAKKATGGKSTVRSCVLAGGKCASAASNTCSTPFKSGLCPGSADMKCCVGKLTAKAASSSTNVKKSGGTVPPPRPSPPTPTPSPVTPPADKCAAASGKCVDSATNTCSVAFRSGLCPGAATVKCCTGVAAPKPATPTPAPTPAPTPSGPPAPTPSPVTPPADKCAAASGKCVDSATNTCSVEFRSGLCAGAATVKCCTGVAAPKPATPAPTPSPVTPPADKCAAASGKCVDSETNSCSVEFRSGLCAGRASIKCCTGVAAPKPAAPPAPVPTGPVSFSKLAGCYPQGAAEDVKKRIGGAVDASWITNTCAIRMSHTLNCAGRRIPNMGGESIRGKAPESWQYIFRVKQLSPQVKKMFGNGQTFHAPSGRGVDVSNVRGKKGIIYFDTTGEWDDATGHFDLWDGNAMVEANHADAATTEKYFRISRSVTLWAFP